MPDRIVPMLATLGTLPPATTAEWAYEIKWDGVRAIAYSEPGTLRFESRNLRDITALVSRALAAQPRAQPPQRGARRRDRRVRRGRAPVVRAAPARGCTSPATSAAKRLSKAVPGRLRRLRPAVARRPLAHARAVRGAARAAGRARTSTGERWQTPEHVVGDGAGAARRQRRSRASRASWPSAWTRPYEPGRRSSAGSRSRTSSAGASAIVGWLPGEGRRRERIGALLARARTARYVGRVGTGFDEAELDRLAGLLGRHRVRRRRRCRTPRPRRRSSIWVEPRYSLRGRVRRVDERQDAPPPVLQGPGGRRAAEALAAARAAHDRRGPRAQVLEPRQGPVSQGRLHQGRRHRLLPADRARGPAAPRGPAADAQALPERRRGPVLLREELPVAPARLGADGDDQDVVEVDRRSACARTVPTLMWLANLADLELHTSLSLAADAARARRSSRSTSTRASPRRSSSAAASACGCRGCSSASGLQCFAKTSGLQGPAGLRAAERRGRDLRRARAGRRRSPRRSPSCSSSPSPTSSSRA